MIRIGIDLGGTKIEAVALDQAGKELLRRRVPTPRGEYEGTVRAIADLVSLVESEVSGRSESVGIGTPGAISAKTGRLKNSNSTWLINQPLREDLEKALGRSVRLANDANCFTVSEATDGAAQGAEIVFGVILGTGVGGGIVAHGKMLEGANRISGEWGHNALPWPNADEWPGPPCYCGRTGCIETFLSGPGFAADFKRATGDALKGEEIVKLLDQGDPRAAAAFKRYVDRLSRALACVINIVDPDVIVLGGGLSNIKGLYSEVPKAWGKWVFSDTILTRLVQAKHGDSSGVRGAAWL